MGQFPSKDGTAQGVAKIRHYESLHAPERRLYNDPYAHAMYPGSFVQTWLGEGATYWLYGMFGGHGILEMLTIRTRWLDDQIVSGHCSDGVNQLVILGAGYDTRGFRLELPQDTCVFEVDQPEVQNRKVGIMRKLAERDDAVESRLSVVKFVPVDFNSPDDSIDKKLENAEGYSVSKKTIVCLEGVTQYIPKESTADTLTKLKKIVAPGSKLLLTYVDQNVFDDPSKCGPAKVVEKVTSLASRVGEPWISGWTREGFASFMKEMGYEVLSDTSARDYNEQYLAPLDRELKEEDMLSMERFVVATIKG